MAEDDGAGVAMGQGFESLRSEDFATARTSASDMEPTPRGDAVYLSSSSNEDRAEFYSSRDDPTQAAPPVTMPFAATGDAGGGAGGGYSISIDPSQAPRISPSDAAAGTDAPVAPASGWVQEGWGEEYDTTGRAEDEVGGGVDDGGAGGSDPTHTPAAAAAPASEDTPVAGAEVGYDEDDPDVDAVPLSNLSVEDVFSLARHNKVDRVASLLDKGLPVNIRDVYGNTVLAIACQNGLKRMAKAALRRGADLNSVNYRGNTPLHFCYMYGYGDTLGQYLISKGADASRRNDEGMVCYEVANTK